MRIFCSICKDIFIPYSEVHVTNCGHLYHASCISTWIKQHRTCPQCRTTLSQPFRVYFDVDKDNETDPSTLEHQVETLSDKLRETEREKKNIIEEKNNFEKLIGRIQECALTLSKKNDVLKTSVKALKEQVTKLTKQNEAFSHLEKEVELWKAKASTLERVETLVKGSAEEVNKLIESTPISGLAVKQLCTYVGILKAQLQKTEGKNINLSKENRDLERKLNEEKRKCSSESEEKIKNLKESNSKLEKELLTIKILLKNYKKRYSEKNEEAVSTPNNVTQVQISEKQHSVNIDLQILDEEENSKLLHPAKVNKTINHWEELVCAGPSRNFGLPLKKSFNKTTFNEKDDKDVLGSNEGYAFDGLGGRKKLRLGGPTPLKEFEKIKKKKDKSLPTFQHKKIIEFYQKGF